MDLLDVGAADLGRRLGGGESTVEDHIERVLERIGRRDPGLNAFSQLNPGALSRAGELDAMPAWERETLPLFGVPVAVKEEIEVAGLVTTLGGRGNTIPTAVDSEVVARLRAAGAIIIGKTNMPEFGQVPFTEGEWGATHNPCDPARSPGGSSGGSAVAVASGMVPLALGGDAGGSIRIPAAWNGVFGIKPSRGRVSTAPHPNLWHKLGTYGPLARSVEDLRLAMAVTAPEDPGPGLDGTLRVGWSLESCLPGVKPDPQVARAVARAADRLAEDGHEVTRGSIRWAETPLTFMVQFHLGVLDEVRRLEHPERIEKRSQRIAAMARMLPPGALRWAERSTTRVERAMERIFRRIDVLLTPVTPTLPPPIRRVHRMGYLAGQQISAKVIAYTSYWNLAGHPALSVPVGISSEGLPLAVQVIGRPGEDDLVLEIGERLNRY